MQAGEQSGDDPVIPPTTEGPGSFGESRPGERVGMGEEGGPHGDIPTKGFEPHE